jgi:transaldolase / glucose-6-phosphate isomerase
VSNLPPAVTAHLSDELRETVDAKLALADRERVSERLWNADATLWGPAGTPELANRLGWLTIAERMLAQVDELEAFAAELRDAGVTDVVLLGMGGSSLAPEVILRSFGEQSPGRPRLHVLDSTDAATVRSVEQAIDPRHSLFIVSSKSGGTIEPLSMLAHFWELTGDGSRFAAITDPGSGLAELAARRGFRRTFLGDPDIGGRYSALSPFGVVPAALIGLDIAELLSGAAEAKLTPIQSGDSAEQPAGVWLGAALSALAQAGRDKLTFLVSEPLGSLGLWLEQLFAESTGKHGTGILPVADERLGAPAAYGADRVFMHVHNLDAPDDGVQTRLRELRDAGHPVIVVPTHGDPRSLGRLFMLAEIAVAVAGWGLSINPYDQPNVQQAKDATNKVLARYEADGALPAVADADSDALRALLGESSPPSYVAIMAYLQPSDRFDAAATELRTVIRDSTRSTTTFGYGPRFLHSTGQFHKGGPKVGRFLQLIHDGSPDVAIPGAAYGFTTLKNAQAIGDLNTLRELDLPAERVRLSGADPVAALRELTTRIKEIL